MSSNVLTVLHLEHRRNARLLDLFERQIVLLEHGLEANTDLLKDLIGYLRTVPEVYHHPKEDLILRAIARRAPDVGKTLSTLAEDHAERPNTLHDLTRALVDMLLEPEDATSRFIALARRYIKSARHHMAWEDDNFFDIAQQTLLPEDWADIEQRLARLEKRTFPRAMPGSFDSIGAEFPNWRC